jgi:hypothetical protein
MSVEVDLGNAGVDGPILARASALPVRPLGRRSHPAFIGQHVERRLQALAILDGRAIGVAR